MTEKPAARKTFRVSRSRTFQACVYESGGAYQNGSASAQIISDEHGAPIQPIFVRGMCRPNTTQAVFTVAVGYHIFDIRREQGRTRVDIYRVSEVLDDSLSAERIGYFASLSDGTESRTGEIPAFFDEALCAAMEKSECVNCQCVHYAFNSDWVKTRGLREQAQKRPQNVQHSPLLI